eukprot:scaffold2012_cov228-Pinguiococcus_pyrenoidosus.AAC.12
MMISFCTGIAPLPIPTHEAISQRQKEKAQRRRDSPRIAPLQRRQDSASRTPVTKRAQRMLEQAPPRSKNGGTRQAREGTGAGTLESDARNATYRRVPRPGVQYSESGMSEKKRMKK